MFEKEKDKQSKFNSQGTRGKKDEMQPKISRRKGLTNTRVGKKEIK
jgi:hypothetical protein